MDYFLHYRTKTETNLHKNRKLTLCFVNAFKTMLSYILAQRDYYDTAQVM